ncbi:MAG: NHLP bacteriocin system secretion protein [Granulosicoccus sp.]
MARDIFRKDVLDRMASPDRLDHSVRLVRSAQWLFLLCLAAILMFALAWSILANLPVKVATRGVLVDPTGLSEITVAYDGRVDTLNVDVGDRVGAGDIVATLVQNVRQRDIDLARTELLNARNSADQAARNYADSEAQLQASEERRLESIVARQTDITAQLASREGMVDDIRSLMDEQIATMDELLVAIDIVDQLRAEQRSLEQQQLDIWVAAEQRERTREREALDFTQRIGILQRELDRLTVQVGDETTVVATRDGIVVELKVNAGDVLQEGEAIALVNPSNDNEPLEAIIYLAPGDGKRVKPGMRAEIMPSTTAPEIYGHVVGTVTSVTSVPATPAGMRRQLRNDALVAELSAAGAPLEIRVALTAHATNSSGLTWSSSAGPATPLSEGTMITGNIVVERRRVIDVLFPGLNRQWRAAVSSS